MDFPRSRSSIALVTLFGCGKGSSPSANTNLSVALTQVPPAQIGIGQTALLIATVTNDPTDSGVTWGVSCGAAKCGSLSPTSTLSGAATTYVAPSAVPTGNTVNITATSVADTSQKVTVTITISVATQQVAIAFSEAPPSTINVSQQVMLAATVTDDPTNAGVDWTVTCGGGSACGSFNPTHTSSGATTTYTAPSSVPNGNVVNITATATADPMVSVTSSPTIVSNVLTVTITQLPTNPLTVGTTTMVTAAVTNDFMNEGVNWTVTCGSADCGSFNPTQPGNGVPTTYTAPSMVPTGNTVTLIASAVAAPTINATTTVTITTKASLNSLLKGQYVLSLSGTDSEATDNFYSLVGSFPADGEGNIGVGEEDLGDGYIYRGPVSILGGSYQIGLDGRGTMYLYNNGNIGISCQDNPICSMNYMNQGAYVQTIALALVSSNHSQVIEFDASATSSGSLDLQNPSDLTLESISGGYSFVFSGVDFLQFPTLLPAALGGIFAADGKGGFTGTEDFNDNGKFTSASFTGNYISPDAFGRVSTANFGNSTFVFYVVSSTDLKFIEAGDDPQFSSGGSAYSQGTSLGNGYLSGDYVFTGAGFNGTGASAPPRAEGGVFHADGGGTLNSGVIDINNNGTVTGGAAFTGTYSISSGRGAFTITETAGVSKFEVYVTATEGPLFLEIDSGSLSSGSGISQSSGITAGDFKGDYAANYTSNRSSAAGNEQDFVGQLDADGISALTGNGDINLFNENEDNNQVADFSVTGTFTDSNNGNGRFTGMLSSTLTGPLQEVYFVTGAAGGNTVLFVEVGTGGSPTVGIMQVQNLQTQ